MDGMVTSITIANRMIGPEQPVYIIAEAGVNHNGKRELALRLIDAAADAGADAVKFQSFHAELLTTWKGPKADWQKLTTGVMEAQQAMLKRLELLPEDFAELKRHSANSGIQFLSTPFDIQSAECLRALEVPAFKVASGELTDLHFL